MDHRNDSQMKLSHVQCMEVDYLTNLKQHKRTNLSSYFTVSAILLKIVLGDSALIYMHDTINLIQNNNFSKKRCSD